MNTEKIFKLIGSLNIKTEKNLLDWNISPDSDEYVLELQKGHVLMGKNKEKSFEIEIDTYSDDPNEKSEYEKVIEENEYYYIKVLDKNVNLAAFFAEKFLDSDKEHSYEPSLKMLYDLIKEKYSIKIIDEFLEELEIKK